MFYRTASAPKPPAPQGTSRPTNRSFHWLDSTARENIPGKARLARPPSRSSPHSNERVLGMLGCFPTVPSPQLNQEPLPMSRPSLQPTCASGNEPSEPRSGRRPRPGPARPTRAMQPQGPSRPAQAARSLQPLPWHQGTGPVFRPVLRFWVVFASVTDASTGLAPISLVKVPGYPCLGAGDPPGAAPRPLGQAAPRPLLRGAGARSSPRPGATPRGAGRSRRGGARRPAAPLPGGGPPPHGPLAPGPAGPPPPQAAPREAPGRGGLRGQPRR